MLPSKAFAKAPRRNFGQLAHLKKLVAELPQQIKVAEQAMNGGFVAMRHYTLITLDKNQRNALRDMARNYGNLVVVHLTNGGVAYTSKHYLENVGVPNEWLYAPTNRRYYGGHAVGDFEELPELWPMAAFYHVQYGVTRAYQLYHP